MGYHDFSSGDMLLCSALAVIFFGGMFTAISCEVGKGQGWDRRNDQLVEERSEAIAAPLVRLLLTPDALEKYKACDQANPCRNVEDSTDRVACHQGFMTSCLGVKPRAEKEAP